MLAKPNGIVCFLLLLFFCCFFFVVVFLTKLIPTHFVDLHYYMTCSPHVDAFATFLLWGAISKTICGFQSIISHQNSGFALKGTHFYIFFVVTATGVVPCGSPKKQPRTSSIVQFIFFFWSFEISGNILRNQNILYV